MKKKQGEIVLHVKCCLLLLQRELFPPTNLLQSCQLIQLLFIGRDRGNDYVTMMQLSYIRALSTVSSTLSFSQGMSKTQAIVTSNCEIKLYNGNIQFESYFDKTIWSSIGTSTSYQMPAVSLDFCCSYLCQKK